MHIDHVPRLGRGPPRGLIHAARGILVSQPDQRPIGFKGVAVARSEVSTGVNVDQCRPMAVKAGRIVETASRDIFRHGFSDDESYPRAALASSFNGYKAGLFERA
jgi:hypothetical protein